MDSFEFNKVLGALLGALTLLVGVLVFSSILFEDHIPEVPGYIVEVPEEGEGGTDVAEFVTPLPVLLASASVEDGQAFVRACASCHNFGKGEPNKVGPHLWGVHERQIAAIPDFSYSEALASRSGEPWSFENMNGFLTNPRAWAPGTTMGYAGIRRDTDRANVLAYLNSLSDSPEPLPTQEEAAVILAEAQAAFDAAQGGEVAEGAGIGDEAADALVQDEGAVVTDEAIELEAGLTDANEGVKLQDGALQTPTPPSEIKPVVTGEDIAIEANEDAAIVEGGADIAAPAPIIGSSSADGQPTGIATDPGAPAAPVAVPGQQTVPAIPNAAQTGTLANPSPAIERSGAEGHSPAAAQPGPSPGVEAEDTAGAAVQGGGQPAVVEESIEAVDGPATLEAPAVVPQAAPIVPASSAPAVGDAAAPGAPVQGAPAQPSTVTPIITTTEPTPAPNVTTTTREVEVKIERVGEPKVIIVPSEGTPTPR